MRVVANSVLREKSLSSEYSQLSHTVYSLLLSYSRALLN